MRHSVGSEYHQQDWNIEQVSKLNVVPLHLAVYLQTLHRILYLLHKSICCYLIYFQDYPDFYQVAAYQLAAELGSDTRG